MNDTEDREDRDQAGTEEPAGAKREPDAEGTEPAAEPTDDAPAPAPESGAEEPGAAEKGEEGDQPAAPTGDTLSEGDAPAARDASADETTAEPEARETEPQEPKKGKPAGPKAEVHGAPVAPQQPPGAHLEPDVAPLEQRSRPVDEEAEVFARYAEPEVVESEEPEEPEKEEEKEEKEPEPELEPLQRLQADARFSATGKRKTSVARVILKLGSGEIVVNGKTSAEVFPRPTLQAEIRRPLEITGNLDRLDVTARIHGGGVSSQAAALRHGIARALVEADPALRTPLKKRGMLTRDARIKERRKAGLKKARKRPQFSKR